VAQADQIPATGMSPQGISGFDTINPNSPWSPPEGDIEQAKSEVSQASSPKTDITLFFNDSPGHKEIATAVQAQWNELGVKTTLKQQEWAQFLEFLGPPPNSAVDVYRLGWIYDFPDAINGLELWTCDSGNNNTNYCDKAFDDTVTEAKATPDEAARTELYAQLEDMLFGQDGAMPILPIYWYTYTNLENQSIKETFEISPLDQIDFTKVVVQG
jgi:ABC-type oligopeptide transport system substrate-binding subunit